VIHPDPLRLEAYFDNEMDALDAAELERHVEQCIECRAYLLDLEQTRAALRRGLKYTRAPPALRAQLARALDRESTARTPKRFLHSFWSGAFGGACTAAAAAVLAFVIWVPPLGVALVDDLVGAHLRSLMPDHLIDVVSTDRHTVKPWFAGHTDVSPVVEDFAAQGYRLVGARADYVDRQRAAVLVYQHGAHVINVFSWSGNQHGLPGHTTRNGYQLIFWRSGDLDYCAVSDTAPEELLGLVRLLQGIGAGGT
jgi:anti-sigma factor RsiW